MEKTPDSRFISSTPNKKKKTDMNIYATAARIVNDKNKGYIYLKRSLKGTM